jgi:hypothetical protein
VTPLTAHIDGLGSLELEWTEIREDLNDYPRAVMGCLLSDSAFDALSSVGASVEIRGGAESLFLGSVESVSASRRVGNTHAEFSLTHTIAKYDRHPQKRIFGTGERIYEVRELPNLAKEILNPIGLSGTSKLTRAVTTCIQVETDWGFLRRIASQNGAYLLVDKAGVHVKVISDSNSPIMLRSADVRSISATTRVVEKGALAHRWNRATGEIAAPERVEGRASHGRLSSRLKGMGEAGANSPLDVPSLLSARTDQTNWLASRAAEQCTVRIVMDGRTKGVGVSSLVHLPADTGFEGQNFLIVSTRLNATPTGSQLEAEGVIEGTLPSAGTVADSGVQLWLGQVSKLPVADAYGRIAVRFAGDASPEGSAVACDFVHPFAGKDGKTVGGTWNVPALNDWVVALVNPATSSVPVVLGSLYKGNAKASDICKEGRVLFAFGSTRIEVDATGSAILLSVSGGDAARSIRIDQAGLTINGPINVRGNLNVR